MTEFEWGLRPGCTDGAVRQGKIRPSALQTFVGSQATLAIRGAAADTFYVNSKEATTGRPQLAVTTG